MRGQGRAGGGNAGGGRACLGLDPHGRLGVHAREAASADESKEGLVIIHKVEGYHAIEQSLIGRKVLGMLRLIVQALSDRRGRFRHARFLSVLQYSAQWFRRTPPQQWTRNRNASRG